MTGSLTNIYIISPEEVRAARADANGSGQIFSECLPTVTSTLHEIIAKALAHSPGDRFQSADEFASALRLGAMVSIRRMYLMVLAQHVSVS